MDFSIFQGEKLSSRFQVTRAKTGKPYDLTDFEIRFKAPKFGLEKDTSDGVVIAHPKEGVFFIEFDEVETDLFIDESKRLIHSKYEIRIFGDDEVRTVATGRMKIRSSMFGGSNG